MIVSFIGNGNIAWHLATFFHDHGHHISTVYGRSEKKLVPLARKTGAKFSTDYSDLASDPCDVLIIAISDDAIAGVVSYISPQSQTIVVHTSGATDAAVLARFERYGVIYPPQSLNRTVESDLTKIPFAVEGSDEVTLNKLLTLMQTLAPKSFACNSRRRIALHVSAVFVNNFVNALYTIGDEILTREGLDFELLRPIILETAEKVVRNHPQDVQTGPAVRNDKKTINRHLDFLSDSAITSEIYQQLTSFLVKQRTKH